MQYISGKIVDLNNNIVPAKYGAVYVDINTESDIFESTNGLYKIPFMEDSTAIVWFKTKKGKIKVLGFDYTSDLECDCIIREDEDDKELLSSIIIT